MTTDNRNISSFVSSQMPEFVRVDHPVIVSFLSAYYEWLDTNEQYISPMSLESVSDIDRTMDEFVAHFKKEFLLDFPEQLALSDTGNPVDPKKLIKNIKAFYRAKGTEKAYQFLFRIFYDTTVEFYYPKKDILRLSDGKWIKKSSLRTTTATGSKITSVAGYRVYQRNPNGVIVGSARVSSVNTLQLGSYEIAEVFLTGINGTFVANKPVEFFDGSSTSIIENSVLPVVGSIVISNGGSNYKVGDVVVFTPQSGDIGRGATGIVSAVSPNGAITKIRIDNFGVNYRVAPSISVRSARGTGFSGTCSSVGVCAYDGYYANTDGRLSTDKVMQDNHYYQNYSYVLLSEITIDKYRDAIRRLIHPAGLGFFGQVMIKRCNKAQLEHHNELSKFEIPFIGNYAPYTFKTYDNLEDWFKVDGVSVGYDPNIHDTLIIEDGRQNPITFGVNFVEGVSVLNTPDTNGDPFWIVYRHPNRKIKNNVLARIWQNEKNDFLFLGEGASVTGDYSNAWHEWTMTASNRSAWDSGFTGDYAYALLKYDSESEFRRITTGAFFKMEVGEQFDCRTERVEVPALPVVNLSVANLNLSPEAGATIVGNGTIIFTLSIQNPQNLEWYASRSIRMRITRNSQSFRTTSLGLNTTSRIETGFTDGQYTVKADIIDIYDNLVSTSNTLSFGYIFNSGIGPGIGVG
jgi:hypothetical protein